MSPCRLLALEAGDQPDGVRAREFDLGLRVRQRSRVREAGGAVDAEDGRDVAVAEPEPPAAPAYRLQRLYRVLLRLPARRVGVEGGGQGRGAGAEVARGADVRARPRLLPARAAGAPP